MSVETADGRITAVRTDTRHPAGRRGAPRPDPPGLANAHSHAFHRALRGSVQVGSGTFWTWRDVMYGVADRLTPDSYYALARAAYAEMALAGITCVGEFHYLHHAPGGTRYDDPNAMGRALLAAAADAGIRITLLDTAYLSAGFGDPPNQHQLRFSDGTADAWAERADALKGAEHARIGAAVHSVRAVPAGELATVADWARRRQAPCTSTSPSRPRRTTPAGRPTAAPHPTARRPRGAGPAHHRRARHPPHRRGHRAARRQHHRRVHVPDHRTRPRRRHRPGRGAPGTGQPALLGSDSHAVIDLLEEARAMELNERLRTRTRGHWTAAALLRAATADGHAALGWDDAGTLAPGALADLTTIRLDSVRTAGPVPRLGAETAVFAATAADVRHTVVGGRHIVRDRTHTRVPDVPTALADAIAAVRG
ncbi:amidohydrolase family protein [Streptomyces albulus]|nr:amidohydrolase family protein [Streptomyces noursei]